MIAGVISAHFEFAPQPGVPHVVFVTSWFIEPDASCRSRMLGGRTDVGRSTEPQLMTPP